MKTLIKLTLAAGVALAVADVIRRWNVKARHPAQSEDEGRSMSDDAVPTLHAVPEGDGADAGLAQASRH